MATTVINRKYEKEDIYIGRGSKWGNPFKIGPTCTREQAIEQYRTYLWHQIQKRKITIQDLLNLDGKKLGCYCKPQACHGDVLVKAVQWAFKKVIK